MSSSSSSSSDSGAGPDARSDSGADAEVRSDSGKQQDAKSAAGGGEVAKSAAGAGPEVNFFDGQWTGGIIMGNTVTWREAAVEGTLEGNTSQLTQTSSTECSMVIKGKTIKGTLEADGHLHWSDGDVWRRCQGVVYSLLNHPERRRLEREAVERVKEKEKWEIDEARVYIGKRDLPASCDGGGWGGPKEGNDTDIRFMLRGEARELPDYLYKSWEEHNCTDKIIEKKMASRDGYQFDSRAALAPSSDSESGGPQQITRVKKKKGKDKKKGKKNKKGKKDKKKKKSKKEKDKKDKKAGKKKRKSVGA